MLVASIDGVGTKSVMAYRHRGLKSFVGLGKDIVNHSVNDILVQDTGQSLQTIESVTERDYFLSAEEGVEFGLIDSLLVKTETETN